MQLFKQLRFSSIEKTNKGFTRKFAANQTIKTLPRSRPVPFFAFQTRYYTNETSNGEKPSEKPQKAQFFHKMNEEEEEPMFEKHKEQITKIKELLGYNTNLEQSLIYNTPIFEAFVSALQRSVKKDMPFKLLFPCLYLTALHTKSKYVQSHLLLFAERVKYNHLRLQNEISTYKQSSFFEEEEKAILDYITEAHAGSVSLVHFEKLKNYVEEETIFEIFNLCGLVSFLSTYSNCLQIKLEDNLPSDLQISVDLLKNNTRIKIDNELKDDVIDENYNNIKIGDKLKHSVQKMAVDSAESSSGNFQEEYTSLISKFSEISSEEVTDDEKRKKVLLYGVKNSFGFIPNFMMGYSKYPTILRSALVLFNSIFQESQSVAIPMKLIIAIEAARGLNYRYLELVFTYLANKEKVPITKLIQPKFTSNSITLQKIFNLSREITSSFGRDVPFTSNSAEQLRVYLSKQQLAEVASTIGYLSYLRYITYSIFPLPEPAIVSFADYLQSNKEAK